MKKVLSFVLVLAMILGSVSLAFATSFPDTEGTDYDEAARLLSDLGVLSGYADGTFKPENNVTRAEFAAMMVRALGFQVAGTSAVTAFSDVPATYWASTYIKYASELGIIYGYNDGTFRPKNNITNDEAIAMLVRTLGYQAKYMAGSYPTSHINVALGLEILDGIPTGSAAATRGTIAQLLFNALDCNTVTYDAQGNLHVTDGASFLERLGGTYYDGGNGYGEPFVMVPEDHSAAKGVNLRQYTGAYVKAYAMKNDRTKIIAISKVYSEFVTDWAVLDAGKTASFDQFKKNDTIGDAKLRNNPVNTTDAAMDWAVFYNGKEVGELKNDETKAFTFAVKKDGNYIAKVYSVAEWDATRYFQVTAEDLEELKEDLTFYGEKFAYDNKDKIDTSSFGLFGVDSLDDIKEGNIVALYVGDGVITRVEVGTKTVDGEIVRVAKTPNGKATIGGTAYSQNPLDGNKFDVGQKGTFYLDYQGRLAACDTGVTAQVGVLMATRDSLSDSVQLANGKSGAKILLFTADGKAVEYDVHKNAKFVEELADGKTTTSALVADGKFAVDGLGNGNDTEKGNTRDDATDDILVKYNLNSNDQISQIQVVGQQMTDFTDKAKVDVTKKGTAVGCIFNEDTVLFSFDGGDFDDYSVLKLSAILGSQIDANTWVYFGKADSMAVTAALVTGAVSEADTYVAFNGADKVKGGYEIDVVGTDGKAVVYTADFSPKEEGIERGTAMLYKLSFNKEVVTTMTPVDKLSEPLTTTSAAMTAEKTKVVNGKNGYTFNYNDGEQFTVARDVVVFVLDGKEWVAKGASALNKLEAGATVTAFDTKADKDVITYEVVFVEE